MTTLTGSNYDSWRLNIDSMRRHRPLNELIRSFIDFAVLAPSSHNSQPWAFKVEEDKILVFVNPERRLVASDINDRQLYISLGCAITNIRIAADYFGYSTTVEYTIEVADNLAATLTFKSNAPNKSYGKHLIHSIITRANNRNPFDQSPIPKEFIESIKSRRLKSCDIYIVEDKKKIEKLAEVATKAGIAAMENRAFRLELSEYVKSNITKSPTGMPCFGMNIPTPASFLAPVLLRFFNMNKISAKKDFTLLTKHTAAIGIISSPEDNPNMWMAAGEYFEEVSLFAEQNGIRIGMLAAPIQIADYYKEIQEILNISTRPQAFFRMGYTSIIPPHSPRLAAGMVLINEYLHKH